MILKSFQHQNVIKVVNVLGKQVDIGFRFLKFPYVTM